MDEHSRKIFGEHIRKQRLEKKITLRKFAESVGLSYAFVSRMEQGDFNPPSEETIKRIASRLDIDMDDLLALAGKVSSDVIEILLQDTLLIKRFRNYYGQPTKQARREI